MENCVFCNQPIDIKPSVCLRQKGVDGILRTSNALEETRSISVGQYVHVECRKKYTRDKIVCKIDRPTSNICRLRSDEPQFNFKEHCLFCGLPAKFNERKRGIDVYKVRIIEFDTSIRNVCNQRKDCWSEEVRSRLLYAPADLFASGCIYHQTCSVNFRTGKDVPKNNLDGCSKRAKVGRPTEEARLEAFHKTTMYLEQNDEEQISIHDLVIKMQHYLALDSNDSVAYSSKYMKQKLKEYFGDDLFISEINGKPDVVTLKCNAAALLNDYFKTLKNQDAEIEKFRIIAAAAKLIKADIKSIPLNDKFYPDVRDFASLPSAIDYLPKSLTTFLKTLFVGKNIDLKLGSMGHAIVQATRPRSLTVPLQIGLGVQMHHHFGSRFLIDSLHSHGFCSSYADIQKYERSAAIIRGTILPPGKFGKFIQYAADNVDHNIRTLDGLNTFHGMGMIATVSPGITTVTKVPKRKVHADDLAAVGQIKLKCYNSVNSSNFHKLEYGKLPAENSSNLVAKTDVLWKFAWPIRKHRPNWSGMMQAVHTGNHPGISSILFLPIIDVNPNDMSCIYTTLLFIASHARKYGVTPVITFDQPLWWKALQITNSAHENSDLKSIVLRLGGLHTIMSFLGAIGHIMSGSGLRDTLGEIYAETVVSHMLSGKAMTRAIRGHFLVDTALHTTLISTITETYKSRNEEENEIENDSNGMEELNELGCLYDKLMTGKASIDDVCSSDALSKIKKTIESKKETMMCKRTARLWIQYMEMLDILRAFIRAERTGNWGLHLASVEKMLPYFAATGHNLYTKSCRVYLQIMKQLSEERLVAASKVSTVEICTGTVFKYELCSHPPALFDGSGLMREANKPVLADAIWRQLNEETTTVISQGEIQHVIDGGYLLQKLPWSPGSTYKDICQIYAEYILKKYAICTVVFDGYQNGPSSKDVTHYRRACGRTGLAVKFAEEMVFKGKKEEFLRNKENKQKFIFMLSQYLRCIHVKSLHAEGDADLLIVQTAIEAAKMSTTILIGEDTDLLILLCHHLPPDSPHNIIFTSQAKIGVKKPPKIWNVLDIKKQIGETSCKHLLFAHALLGCDTTSRVFGIGKGVALQKLKKSDHFLKQAEEFYAFGKRQEGSIKAGVMQPIVMELPPAPDALLKVIRCNCKGNCSSSRCNCRKHNLECSPACGECKGISCSNTCQQNDDFDDDCLNME